MKLLARLLPLALFVPMLAFAQAAPTFDPFRQLIQNIINFINNVLVPLVFAIAFIVFLWGIFKTFIQGGGNEESQAEGKKLMIYAIIGFVVMVSIWGLVNFVSSGFGFGGQTIQNIPATPTTR